MDSDNLKLAPELLKQKKEDVITSHRSKRNVYTVFHNFQSEISASPVPDNPLPEAFDELSKRRLQGASLNRLKTCFKSRPIWSRTGLEFETQLEDMTLKYGLPCVAYFANSGPWRSLWIRLGYDPRQNPSSFMYQTVDYRVPCKIIIFCFSVS
jgi:general transcription factor 3C polypeptide 5 (transcription factor C subunit 1)